MGYRLVNLYDMINELGEDAVKRILSNFSCPLNKDVEKFLRLKAIEFARQGYAATHLLFTSYQSHNVLIGYFSLSIKSFTVKAKALKSNTLRKRILKFGTYDDILNQYIIPAPLIAQLSKNFYGGYNKLITGDELLKIAKDKVKSLQTSIGGKIVYLECEDKIRLTEFYESNGFYNFGKRSLDRKERETLYGDYLIQMLAYLK